MLGTGDELAVQLFFAATALAVLSLAVTQAGWRHPILLLGLFGSGLALTFIAGFWPSFAKHVPIVQAYVGPIITHPLTWFVSY
jgi:hypothetical protein